MNMTSTLYTIGTALHRAYDNRVPVALLVEGQWMEGQVAAVDAYGIVLDRDGVDHCVVRLERVSAVRVNTAAPAEGDTRSAYAPPRSSSEPSITQNVARHERMAAAGPRLA
jgi:sRNA-binding regulator protein Hfq